MHTTLWQFNIVLTDFHSRAIMFLNGSQQMKLVFKVMIKATEGQWIIMSQRVQSELLFWDINDTSNVINTYFLTPQWPYASFEL